MCSPTFFLAVIIIATAAIFVEGGEKGVIPKFR